MNRTGIKPVVVIPCHKASFSQDELIGVRRVFDVLSSHAIVVLAPASLSSTIRATLSKELGIDGHALQLHCVPDACLSSIHAYNQLMLSKEFYSSLSQYSHILICQLDAYVFKDSLLDWCDTEWDYIGAPIYYPRSTPYGEEHCQCTGAGGFSLRRVSSLIKALDLNPVIFTRQDFQAISKPFNTKGKLNLLGRLVICSKGRSIRIQSHGGKLDRAIGINEDVVLGLYLPKHQPWFKVAGYQESASFSIDYHVTAELKARGGELPFGTHAWCTSSDNREAWLPYIQEAQLSP